MSAADVTIEHTSSHRGALDRRWLLGVALTLFVLLRCAVASAAASTAPTHAPSHAAAHAVRWGFLIGIGVEVVIVVALALSTSVVRMLVIGQDNRLSTSKTIAAIWTFVVAAALFALVYANLLNHPQALNATNSSGVVGQYAVLFGGPLGAAILAKGITVKQVAADPTVKQPAQSASLTDLVSNDSGNADLGDFQYVLFNLVALLYVVGTLLHNPTGGLPNIPDVLLGLTSVSAVGYVGKKAIPQSGAVTASAQPQRGAAEAPVTIAVTGLSPATQTAMPLWVRFEGDVGVAKTVPVSGGIAQVEVNSPTLASAPQAPVPITLVTGNGTVISAGTFTYE